MRRRVRFCAAQAERKCSDKMFASGNRYKFSTPHVVEEVKMLQVGSEWESC